MASPYESVLLKLKEEDPELYESYLESGGKLDLALFLNDESDDSDSNSSVCDESRLNVEEESELSDTDQINKTVSESVLETDPSIQLTIELLSTWEGVLIELSSGKRIEITLSHVYEALKAAVFSIGDARQSSSTQQYTVDSTEVFDKLVSLCLRCVVPALRSLLNVNNLAFMANSKKFMKYSTPIKEYIDHLLQLCSRLSTSTCRQLVLRHGVAPLYACYRKQPDQCKLHIEQLINIWAKDTDQRVKLVAFVAITKTVKIMDAAIFDFTVTSMYRHYVKCCHDTSSKTRSLLSFMRMSLAELYTLDQTTAYTHAFDYLGLMHEALKQAKDCPTPVMVDRVYNWQWVQSLHLWCTLVGSVHSHKRPNKKMDPILQYAVEALMDSLSLQPSVVNFPLILQLCGIATEMSTNTQVYIPVLPYLTKVLTEIKGSKCTNESVTDCPTPDWSVTLKLSSADQQSLHTMKSFQYHTALHITRYLVTEAYSIAFPEMVEPLLQEFRVSKELFAPCLPTQLEAKVIEHSDYISSLRQGVDFQLKQAKQIQDWETALSLNPRLPIVVYNDQLAHYDTNTNAISKSSSATSKVSKKEKRRRDKVKRKSKAAAATAQAYLL